MFSFKYELSRMIAREKFTGLSPEIIMEEFRCNIGWCTWYSVTVIKINEHAELQEVANQWYPEVNDASTAESVARFCNI